MKNLREAFIEEVKRREMSYKIVKNVVQVVFKPKQDFGMGDVLSFIIVFFDEEYRIIIPRIALAQNRYKVLMYLNELNKSKNFGKFYINKNGEIEYGSFKQIPEFVDDVKLIFKFIWVCLMEVGREYEHILINKHCKQKNS